MPVKSIDRKSKGDHDMHFFKKSIWLLCSTVFLSMGAETVGSAPVEPTPRMPANSVDIRMGKPVVVDQAPPDVQSWGPWRMPKIFKMPTGETWLTFAVGDDVYRDQGKTSPAFVTKDDGKTWLRSEWPHNSLRGMSPVVSQVLNGEYLCIRAGEGITLDRKALPKPIGEFPSYGDLSVFRLAECPKESIAWFKEIKAARWSPKSRKWSEESVKWDHQGQLIYTYNNDGNPKGASSQKVYFENPILRCGNELLHADYWTQYQTDPNRIPESWGAYLMVSTDNGHSWKRRSTIYQASKNDSLAEPFIQMNQKGEIVAVLRRDLGKQIPMYLLHSRDRGQTWTKPTELFAFGVFPQLLMLDNGIMVLSFGRPGVWISFSIDGGYSWSEPEAVLEKGETDYKKLIEKPIREQKKSCGYTSLLALTKDSFLIAYSDFRVPNAQGKMCKSILVREITVKKKNEF